MNILQSMISLYNHLMPDSTYRNVLKGILRHLPEAADSNVYELADLTNSSRTTIRRMLAMIGYDSYQDFHFALKQAVNQYTYYNRLMGSDYPEGDQTFLRIISEQFALTQRRIGETLQSGEIRDLAKRVRGADKVFFFFPYSSAAICSFQQNLSISGIETALVELSPEMSALSEGLTENSVVFCQTIEHAEVKNISPVFQKMKEKGAYMILIGAKPSQYDGYVNKHLFQGKEFRTAWEDVLIVETFFLALSEEYRKRYIGFR